MAARKAAPAYRPWHPEGYELPEVAAIQGLMRGEATPEQQKHALDWIINSLCRTYDSDWIPDSDRDSSFAAGKRWPGQQLVKLTKLSTARLRKNSDEPTEQG